MKTKKQLAKFGVMSIPTLIVFKNGEVVDKVVGFQPKEALAERVRKTRYNVMTNQALAWNLF